MLRLAAALAVLLAACSAEQAPTKNPAAAKKGAPQAKANIPEPLRLDALA